MSIFSSVQSLSHVQLFATPWTVACQGSQSIISSQSLLKLMSIESVMPSNHLIFCHPLLFLPSIFPSIRVFPMSHFFASGGQSIGVSASASVLPMNIQDWFPLGCTGLNFVYSKGLSRVFSNTKKLSFIKKKKKSGGFHGSLVVKTLPTQCRGHRFDPWSGKIPQVEGQLSPSSHNCWTHMPQLLKLSCLEPMLSNKRSPGLLWLQKAFWKQQKDPAQPKIK